MKKRVPIQEEMFHMLGLLLLKIDHHQVRHSLRIHLLRCTPQIGEIETSVRNAI